MIKVFALLGILFFLFIVLPLTYYFLYWTFKILILLSMLFLVLAITGAGILVAIEIIRDTVQKLRG